MRTLKLHYTTEKENLELIKQYIHQYFICFKAVYNMMKDGFSQKDIKEKLKLYKNVELINKNSFMVSGLLKDVSATIASQDEVLKKLKERLEKKKFKNYRQKNKIKKAIKYLSGKICFNRDIHRQLVKNIITKEEFKTLNVRNLCSVGDSLKNANRFFRIKDNSTIIFQPNRKIHIELDLYGHKNHKKFLGRLKEIQENCSLPLTYRLDENFIYLSYDEEFFMEKDYKPVENRVLAIDMNPNYIGYSVLDWYDTENGKFKIIESGVLSQKSLNDYELTLHLPSTDPKRKQIKNKRDYETFQISKFLVEKAKHYRCKHFAIEDLSIDTQDLGRGRNTNRLCINQWNRNKLVNNLEKRCNLIGIELSKVPSEYTSFLGNTIFRYLNLPDMVLASIEISRRCYEYYLQYEKKTKVQEKIIRFPRLNEFVKHSIEKTMEVLSIPMDFENYMKLFWYVKKNLQNRYRVYLDESRILRQKHMKYQLLLFNGS